MESEWASEHLQVIRTLMERAAVYRRALAPVMIYNGCLGLAAAVGGLALGIAGDRPFIMFWAAIALLGLIGSFLLVRRQALKEKDLFWSPPTRRVTEALLPPIVAGFVLAVVLFVNPQQVLTSGPCLLATWWLPSAWVVLYGCAFHAAGFFMPRGMKLFGWIFILGGCGLFWLGIAQNGQRPECGHGIMGLFFGLFHLAYGVYLYFTESRGTGK
jgi:hypothetical protein